MPNFYPIPGRTCKPSGLPPHPHVAGEVYGDWTILGPGEKTPGSPHARWLCRCRCGRECHVIGSQLRSGLSTGCRWCKASRAKYCDQSKLTQHELTRRTYTAMLDRCRKGRINKSNERYVGRGIEVCDRWLESYENFVADMGLRTDFRLTIDRIDNDGHYEPSNCRWATPSQQNRNQSKNRMIEHDGRIQCLQDWAAETGWSATTISNRLKRGMSIAEALKKRV